MSMFDNLKVGGIAVVGRTGSGKSPLFFGSRYVRDIIISDTGSMGHKLYHGGEGECEAVDSRDLELSPVKQVLDRIERYEKERRLWCLDSWSALEAQQVAWFKMKWKLSSMARNDHKAVIGDMRDLALKLAEGHGFTLFNTGQGGWIIPPDGKQPVHSPRGAITGYPSLSGAAPGSESVLARFTSVWVVIPPYRVMDEDGVTVKLDVPRGFIRPGDDFRPDEAKRYTPNKDQYGVLDAKPTDVPAGTMIPRTYPVLPTGTCMIDVLLDEIATKFGAAPQKKRKRTETADVSANGTARESAPSGIE